MLTRFPLLDTTKWALLRLRKLTKHKQRPLALIAYSRDPFARSGTTSVFRQIGEVTSLPALDLLSTSRELFDFHPALIQVHSVHDADQAGAELHGKQAEIFGETHDLREPSRHERNEP